MDWQELIDKCEMGMVYMLETPEEIRDSYWRSAYAQFKSIRDASKTLLAERDDYFSEMEQLRRGREEQAEDYEMHKHDDEIPF